MASLDSFLGKLTGGGARANQFKVLLNTPTAFTPNNTDKEKAPFLIKAAQLPGQTIGEIAVPFRGRNLYIAGDREFETWTTTVINDTDFAVRKLIEQWMGAIANLETNRGYIDPATYQTDLVVQQLDRKDDGVLREYTLIDCWPTTLGAIDLSYETQNEIEQFEVTWRYNYFTVGDGVDSDDGGEGGETGGEGGEGTEG